MRRLHDDHDSKMCLLDTFRRAVANAGGEAAVAAHLGVTPQYLNQICNDKSPLGVRVILKSPDAVQRFLIDAWAEAKGGTVLWPVEDKESAYRLIIRGLLALGGWQPKMLKRLLPMVDDEQECKAG